MAILSSDQYIHDSSSTGGKKRFLVTESTATLAERVTAIGAIKATLEITGTETLTTSLEIPSNISVIMKEGSALTLSGTGTTLAIHGICICEGYEHFVIGDTNWLIFGEFFDAPKRTMFTGAGIAHVRFGLGPELNVDPQMLSASGWTATGWTFNNPGFTHNTGNTSSLTVPTGTAISTSKYYWSCTCIDTWSASTMSQKVGNSSYGNQSQIGWWECYHVPANSNRPGLTPLSGFDGKITYFSSRQVVGGSVEELPIQWWGAANGVDCSPAINAALQAAKGSTMFAHQGYARTVRIGTGRWLCNSPIYHPPKARCFGQGVGSVLVPSTTFATGTVPTYASLKYDAAVAEYDTGFWFLDSGHAGSWVQEILKDLTIDGTYCSGGDLAGTGTKDFTMLYALRNVTYIKIKNITTSINTARRQSHFFAGSEEVTSHYVSDSYDRSGLEVDGFNMIGRSYAQNRFAYHFTGASDAQLSAHRRLTSQTFNTVAILDSESSLEDSYLYPSAGMPKWCDVCTVGSVAGDQLSVVITGRNVSDTRRFPAGVTIYYQRPGNVWGTIALAASSPTTYSGGNTTVRFQTEIPTDVTAIYSQDGGLNFPLVMGCWGNRGIGLYFDSLYDVDMPIMHYSTNGSVAGDTRMPAMYLQNHNISYLTNFANVCGISDRIWTAAAEISGRPDQIKISGNVAAYFTTGKKIYVFHSVDGWRKGTITTNATYDGSTYTTVTTNEPIFRAVSSGTQTIRRELLTPYWSLGKTGLLSGTMT